MILREQLVSVLLQENGEKIEEIPLKLNYFYECLSDDSIKQFHLEENTEFLVSIFSIIGPEINADSIITCIKIFLFFFDAQPELKSEF